MLAAERRGELGIARAVGTRRGHLVQMFMFEGAAYDLIAAAVGALLGAAVAYGMVLVIASAFGAAGEDRASRSSTAVQPRSLFVAFAIGVLLTLLVVAFSAWRVSVHDDLDGDPEPARAPGPAPAAPARARPARQSRSASCCRRAARRAERPRRSCSASRSSWSASSRCCASLGVPERAAYTACGLARSRSRCFCPGASGRRSSARSRWTSRRGSSPA